MFELAERPVQDAVIDPQFAFELEHAGHMAAPPPQLQFGAQVDCDLLDVRKWVHGHVETMTNPEWLSRRMEFVCRGDVWTFSSEPSTQP